MENAEVFSFFLKVMRLCCLFEIWFL